MNKIILPLSIHILSASRQREMNNQSSISPLPLSFTGVNEEVTAFLQDELKTLHVMWFTAGQA